MICPACQTSNPDSAEACSHCRQPLADADKTLQLQGLAASAMPTMAGPASLKEWVRSRPTQGTAASVTLPEGLEIGRRYRVQHLLGEGGMGAVYRVHDAELDRDVAMKLIRSDIAERPAALERFKREIQLSSKVTHKNVLRVYDLGEADGIRFLTMQFVEGEDLSIILRRRERLPVRRLVVLFRQILEGLRAAHEQGVIHRDLKPQNIMVDAADNLYVTDFGLAKSLEQAGVTQTGAVVGTPYYMSPEQVKGTPVDHRSDIYSAGVILYEMATGTLPFTGSTPYEVMAHRVQRPPTPAGELNPELPSYLRKILERCMAVDPTVRYQTVEEVLRDLEAGRFRRTLRFEVKRRRWLRSAAFAAAAIALAAGTALWLGRRETASPGARQAVEPALPVIGVVPFENRTGDADFDWYGEGVARLVADSLAQSRHLRVVSTDRTAALRKDNTDRVALQKAAASAGIGYILTGDILPGSGGLTVSVRLSDTKDGHELSAGRAESLSQKTLVGTADRVALVAKKGLGLPPMEGVDAYGAYGADFVSRNPEAYESYLAGLKAVSGYHYTEAEKAFARALSKAPDYAMARYWFAIVKAASGRTDEALADIRKALEQAPKLPDREARYVRAAEAYFSRRYNDAAGTYRDLIAKYPYEVEARRLLALVLLDQNRPKEAAAEAQTLGKIAPESHDVWSIQGSAHLAMKDFNRAVLEFKKYVELEPGSANGHHLLGDAYRSQGELDLAAPEYEKALQADPSFHYATVALATVDALRGRRKEAAKGLSTLAADGTALPVHRIDAAFTLAAIERAAGRFRESARVLASLEKPIAEEKIRQAQALSERGAALAELGQLPQARRLIALAIERSPGVPTRYLYARGKLELKEQRFDDVRRTAAKILEGALPPEDPDRTEEKAAASLRGRALLAEGKAEAAVEELSLAVTLSGYEYGIYRLSLADAYLAAGRLPEALAAATQSAAPLDPVEARLDLELDRSRSLLTIAEVRKALGREAEAAAAARQFLELWARADAGLPDVAEARRIAAGGR
jgi:tetratricopeptide (TPR) repeat protein/predicted Ser/Thr protein kinase